MIQGTFSVRTSYSLGEISLGTIQKQTDNTLFLLSTEKPRAVHLNALLVKLITTQSNRKYFFSDSSLN
jgi:hypothetical protein